jgi:hypothetical protein
VGGEGDKAVLNLQYGAFASIVRQLKKLLSGTHHAFKFKKYAARYLAEIQCRFNQRANLYAMIPRLLKAIFLAKPCPNGCNYAEIEQESSSDQAL